MTVILAEGEGRRGGEAIVEDRLTEFLDNCKACRMDRHLWGRQHCVKHGANLKVSYCCFKGLRSSFVVHGIYRLVAEQIVFSASGTLGINSFPSVLNFVLSTAVSIGKSPGLVCILFSTDPVTLHQGYGHLKRYKLLQVTGAEHHSQYKDEGVLTHDNANVIS